METSCKQKVVWPLATPENPAILPGTLFQTGSAVNDLFQDSIANPP